MAPEVLWIAADEWSRPGNYSLHPGWLSPVAERTADGVVGVLTDSEGSFALPAHRDVDGVVRQAYPSSHLWLAEPCPERTREVLTVLGREIDRWGLAVDMRLAPQLDPALHPPLAAAAQSRSDEGRESDGWEIDLWEDCFYFESPTDEQELLRRMSRTARQNVARARWKGLEASVHEAAGEALDTFFSLYHHAMARLEARTFLRFPRPFLERVIAGHGAAPRIVLVTAPSGGTCRRPCAATLLLPLEDGYDSWLAASDAAAWSLRPNNLLFLAAALFVCAEDGHQGRPRRLYIGGGPGSLDRFKRGLSNRSLPSFRLRRNLRPEQRAASELRLIPCAPEEPAMPPGHDRAAQNGDRPGARE
jgi:hypothetical protein